MQSSLVMSLQHLYGVEVWTLTWQFQQLDLFFFSHSDINFLV